MNFVTRTIYGAALQTAMFLKLPYVIDPKSTLNERFEILQDQDLPDGQYPGARYFAIGSGGHRNYSGADGEGLTTEVQHLATNAAGYRPLPFILRAITDDLTPTQRARYALRRVETHNGQSYVAYYLRRIDMSSVTIEKQIRTTNEDGSVTPIAFVPSDENLTPVPPELPNVGVNVLAAKSAVVSAQLPINMSPDEIREFMDAVTIIRGDVNYAIISEILLCTGFDRVIQLPDTSNFNEAIGVQVAAFSNTLHTARFISEGIDSHIDAGANEPLLKVL